MQDGQCSSCWIPNSIAGLEDLSELFWDPDDHVWRCALCQWEVEANSYEVGQCHCTTGEGGYVRRIELAEYPDYEPADSDSSIADSTDSEPDSGDEEFIEDDGPFVPSFVNLLAGNYDPFEKMASFSPQPMNTDADTAADTAADADTKT